ncbi:extracellular solute-binding protein [Mesorhizobium liriopis]|uniref:extracellular solute-binding protein n=1 Tax=Mesorhizobium liriopis TaxID=2953882 RepID=UPI003EB95637
MNRFLKPILPTLAFLALATLGVQAEPRHGIAMHGEPTLPATFQHFPYVNPDAPKGGRVAYGWPGTFDSVNPFIVQGSAARGSLDLIYGNNVFDTLMMRSADEPFTLYPLVAKTVETDEARSFVEFTLDERAKFSDGQPITPEDVIFTVELLRDKGLPRYGVTARKIAKMEKVGERSVRFTFNEPDRELPLILGLMPVLPRHANDPATFGRSTLKPLVGSGPYVLENVRPGDSITLRRNPDYWAKDLPSKRGFDNYDEIRLTYYRDENAMFEAFKGGLLDAFIEGSSGRWKRQYNFPAKLRGDVVQETFDTKLASGMLGFVMNTRRAPFDDREVRRALASLFDFEWANRNLLSNAYTRTQSYWDNSDLSSHGVKASDGERKLLAPFPDAVSADIMDHGWDAPVSDGTGRDRNFLRAGFDRLKAAGFAMQNGQLTGKNGRALSFELMLKGRDGEQLASAWAASLARLGITVTIRSVDASQYQLRLNAYDYDMIMFNYTSSLSPGVEQMSRWGSASRDVKGTYNYAGANDPALDAMINAMLAAKDRESFRDATRAFDRVLLSNAYVVPLYYLPEQWLGHWSRIERPQATPIYGYQLPTWWRKQ